MIRVALAEDHNALIDGVKLFLQYEDDIEVVGFANDGEELLKLVQLKRPHVVITDIRMPIKDGIQATKEILKFDHHIKVIAFTMFDQDEAVTQMLDAGARGYLLKNSKLKDLLESIRTVFTGGTYYDPNIVIPDKSTPKKKKGLLTKRQIEILSLVASGKTNQEIADLLFIGKTTVETHRKNMIRKLGLSGVGELLRYAVEKKYEF
ncbi:response regulator transcription factor [Pareuzebyella sediminis]|uniref:response regulator transcription factor n=1 Tax=Pareuzebyella sediminis TaxID=2607998 RepID=UPI0011ED891A|nr:response regulator transcription factor [Pareuzebyella sediminis]